VEQIIEQLSPEVEVLNLGTDAFSLFSDTLEKDNKIREKGAIKIAHMLEKNTSLTHIYLGGK